MSDEIKINKKALIISLIVILLIGSIFFVIKLIPLVSAVGTCSGYARCPRDEGTCMTCGCDWDWEISKCLGSPAPCETYPNEYECDDCGCTWTEDTNIDINIGDAWKDVTDIYINIGDSWKTVSNIYINIGDSWKTVF